MGIGKGLLTAFAALSAARGAGCLLGGATMGTWAVISQVLARIGAVALVGYMAWLGWDYFGPQRPVVGPMRLEVARQLAPDVVADLRKARGDVRTVAVLHLANDPSDVLTAGLRTEIQESGILDVCDTTFMEKVRDGLRLRQPGCANLAAALEEGRSLGVQGVIFGQVNVFESFGGEAKLDVDLRLADVAGRRILLERRYTKGLGGGIFTAANVQEEVLKITPFKRLLAWAVIVLLLPVFTISFIRAMVRRESNRVNAGVLVVYTAVDIILAYLMVGAALVGWASVIIFLIAAAAALGYNVYIMTFAVRLET